MLISRDKEATTEIFKQEVILALVLLTGVAFSLVKFILGKAQAVSVA
ncbi:MAG: hypothetical protein ACFFAS_02270 [Promethearchaeota archaeon]